MSDSFRPSRVPSSGAVGVTITIVTLFATVVVQWTELREFKINTTAVLARQQSEIEALKERRADDSKTAAVLSTEFGAIKVTLAEVKDDLRAIRLAAKK